jgi:hypothetical protein
MHHIAAFVAAKAIVYLLARRDAERRGIFGMERAKPEEVLRALLVQMDIFLYNGYDFVPLLDFFYQFWRDQLTG